MHLKAPCLAVGSCSRNIPWLLPLPKEMSVGTRCCHVHTESQADKAASGSGHLGALYSEWGWDVPFTPCPTSSPWLLGALGAAASTSSPVMQLSTFFYCSSPLTSSASLCAAQPSAAGRAW